jgi:hypothetical protein
MALIILKMLGVAGLIAMGLISLFKPMLLWSKYAVHYITVESYQKRYSKISGTVLILVALYQLWVVVWR